MKKITAIILSAILLLTLLAACGSETVGAKITESSGKLVIIEATETAGSLEDALKALSDAGELTYGGSDSDYGFYLTSLNGIEADASANEYFAVYTTLGEYEGVSYSSSEWASYNHNGKTLGSASYGVSGLPMVKGELYAIVLENY